MFSSATLANSDDEITNSRTTLRMFSTRINREPLSCHTHTISSQEQASERWLRVGMESQRTVCASVCLLVHTPHDS